MAKPHEKLAESLKVLKSLQDHNRHIFRSNEFTRVHRERLVQNGFLKEIVKGWFMSSHPSEADGDSTPWYACFWEFCAQYCEERFSQEWYLSPEQSLRIHAGVSAIPEQVIIYAHKGNNNLIQLPFNTSLYDLKVPSKAKFQHGEIVTQNGLRIYSLESALVKASPSFYQNHPLEAQLALAQVNDMASLVRQLLDGGHSLIAGRLAGAFSRIGQEKNSQKILDAMKAAGYSTYAQDPFAKEIQTVLFPHTQSSSEKRIQGLWETNRELVIHHFPPPPGISTDVSRYLCQIDELYKNDAYHSLSIEGYHVSPQLIEKVSSGQWDSHHDEKDYQTKDALAARGYWQAFQLVTEDVHKILAGQNFGEIIRDRHNRWYQELFQPSVQAGIISPTALAGYRNHPVYLRNSRHVPPRSEIVPEMMSVLCELISNEESPAVRAVLGHWLFGYIHPYPDGNGRIARFIMNALLASGGYPWTIIRVEDRSTYLIALESASVDSELRPFVELIVSQMEANESTVE